MSRSKSHRKLDSGSLAGRDFVGIPRRSLPLRKRDYLREFEDRRMFHPEGVHRPEARFSGRSMRFRIPVVGTKRIGFPKVGLSVGLPKFGFIEPRDVLICVRRKVRREVIHAMGLAGLRKIFRKIGAGSHSEFSRISCGG